MAEFGKLNFATSFNPTSAFPLDARSYFESLEAAQAAASSAVEVGSADSVYHYGETIVVVENGKATSYIIQPDKTLKPSSGIQSEEISNILVLSQEEYDSLPTHDDKTMYVIV